MATPLETVLNNWKQRDAEAQALGIDRSQYQELAKRDVKNVMAGGTAAPASEVNIALISSALGRDVVQAPQRGTGPINTLGNVPKDVEDIVRGFIPGVASWAWNLPKNIARSYLNPQGATAEGREELGYESGGGIGGTLRNARNDPILSLVPGVFTAANATTAEGRKEMQQRPVTTFLDVLPFASKIGKVATAGKVAEKGSATAALQQGHVVRGAFRGAMDTAAKVPKVGQLTSRERWNNFANRLGVDESIREGASRPFSVMSRKADKEQALFMREQVMPLFEGMDGASQAQLTEYLQKRKRGESGGIPEFDAIGAKVDELNDTFYRYGEAEGGLARLYLPGVPEPVTFSTDSPVVLASKRRTRARESWDRIKHRRENAELVREKWDQNLATRQGKVRGFMEDEAAFNARPTGPIGPEVVREASRPMVEAFVNLDPEAVFREYLDKIDAGDVRAQTAAFLMRDFKKLKGEEGMGPRTNTGLVAKFDNAMARGDVKTASQTLTEINRILRHKSWDGFDTSTRIRDHIRHVREELVGLRKRTTSFGYAARMVRKADDRVRRYQDLETAATKKVADADATFFKDLAENPPASFNPLIISKVREGAIDEARLMYQGDELARVERTLATSPVMSEFSRLIGKDKFKAIWDDIHDNWVDLAREGYDPVWVHHVPTHRYEHALKPRLLPDKESRPGQWEKTVTNFGPGVSNIAVALGAASAEIISRKWTHQLLTEHIIPFAKDKATVRDELLQIVSDSGNVRPEFGPMGEVNRIMTKEYRDFNPNSYGMKFPSATTEGLVIPVGLDKALKSFTKGFSYGEGIPMRGLYDKAMRVYKYSVLAGPKQAADAIFGGLLTVMLQEPKALFKMRDAYTMMKRGEVPEELAHNFYELDTDQLWHLAAGKTMGRMMADAAKYIPNGLGRLEEGVTTMYRAATYLSAAEKAVKKGGLSPEMAREVGMRTAYKTLVDFDGMSHIERAVLRNVFPFYSFMRYVMKFVFTYPSDHPLRASILARFADMEKRDREGKGGALANKWSNYFFLGNPDENGNVTAVDYRSLNPFQSVANQFTLAGYLGATNPFIAAGFEAAGVNTLTATPDLYPDMAYDEETGSTTARRGNTAMTVASSFLPPLEGVDAHLTISDKMRRLKQKNPEAYRRSLFQHLHVPFAFGNVNVPYEQAKNQMGKVRGAREELSAAMMSGDWERVKRYNLVPYQGQLVDPARLETFWKAITGALGDRGLEEVSPKALLPR